MAARIVAALCLIALLSACGSNGSLGRRYFAPPPAKSGGTVTPGSPENIDSNVGNTVYFETDRAVLIPDAQAQLQKQAVWLRKAGPQYRIIVEGHADERGTREYNLALGERRAQAVMNYLVALGIDAGRVKTISYGKERPICTDATEACWSQNRRGVTVLDN